MNTGPLFILAAGVLWGTTGTAQALAPLGAHPIAVGTLRMMVGGAGLMLLAYLRSSAWGTVKHMPVGFTLIAVAGMVGFQLSFFVGVFHTGVAVGTVVAIGSAPVLAGFLGWILLRERPTVWWGVATAMAVAGCCLLILTGDAGVTVDLFGIAMALIAGLSYATFTVAARQLVQKVESQLAVAVVSCIGAVLISPVLFFIDASWALQWRGLTVVLYLGLIATAAPYALYVYGLRSVAASTATTLNLAEPLTASLLGIFFLREPLTFVAGCGMVLLLAGLVVLSLGERPPKPVSAT
jgi:DME family drug/metabolite transporter